MCVSDFDWILSYELLVLVNREINRIRIRGNANCIHHRSSRMSTLATDQRPSDCFRRKFASEIRNWLSCRHSVIRILLSVRFGIFPIVSDCPIILINRSCCSIKIRTTADWPLWSCLHQLIAIHIYISPSCVVVRQWLMVGRVMGVWAHWMDEYYCMGTTSVDDSSTDNISYM